MTWLTRMVYPAAFVLASGLYACKSDSSGSSTVQQPEPREISPKEFKDIQDDFQKGFEDEGVTPNSKDGDTLSFSENGRFAHVYRKDSTGQGIQVVARGYDSTKTTQTYDQYFHMCDMLNALEGKQGVQIQLEAKAFFNVQTLKRLTREEKTFIRSEYGKEGIQAFQDNGYLTNMTAEPE